MFKCLECGKKFKTAKAAERASFNGCPKCGGCDVDLDVQITSPAPGTVRVTFTMPPPGARHLVKP